MYCFPITTYYTQLMQLYQARLSSRIGSAQTAQLTVGVLAYDKEMARETIEELYPDSALLQLTLAPEWVAEDDGEQPA